MADIPGYLPIPETVVRCSAAGECSKSILAIEGTCRSTVSDPDLDCIAVRDFDVGSVWAFEAAFALDSWFGLSKDVPCWLY